MCSSVRFQWTLKDMGLQSWFGGKWVRTPHTVNWKHSNEFHQSSKQADLWMIQHRERKGVLYRLASQVFWRVIYSSANFGADVFCGRPVGVRSSRLRFSVALPCPFRNRTDMGRATVGVCYDAGIADITPWTLKSTVSLHHHKLTTKFI